MKKTCAYCGNHRISHWQHYLIKTASIVPETVATRILSRNMPFIERLALVVSFPLSMVLYVLRLYRWDTNPTRALTGRARVLWEEAIERRIPMKQLILMGKPVEFYKARVGGRMTYFNGLPIPPERNAESYSWMDDKLILKRFFLKSGIPVARGGSAWTQKSARRIFETIPKPVIIKPRQGSHGRHSVTHIHTMGECDEAYRIATQLCQCVIVEEQLFGSVYRATYVDGKIVGILRGDPPRVVGDGATSIAGLVQRKNAARHPRVGEFLIDEKCCDFLARQNLTPESTLATGRTLDLSEKVGLSYGGNAVEMIPQTHPELLAILKRAGDLLQAPVVGFDFIIKDAIQSPHGQRWGIIEANAEPFIDLHHNPLEGTAINVAALVWDLWK